MSLIAISSISRFSQRMYLFSLNDSIHHKNEELCMKCLKAEKCFRGLGEKRISGKDFVHAMCLQVEVYQRK